MFELDANGELSEMLDFLNVFEERHKEESEKLPFPVNLIECIGINEVGHSRILAKLFQYKDSNKHYVVLKSLIEKLKFDIKVNNPKITQEEERIDIWVRDENYAIIFENKACDATDQDTQLCRYIDITKRQGYNEEQIYVIYYYCPLNHKDVSPTS